MNFIFGPGMLMSWPHDFFAQKQTGLPSKLGALSAVRDCASEILFFAGYNSQDNLRENVLGSGKFPRSTPFPRNGS